MTKWYVTVNENSDHADDPDARVWTVSRDPDDTGWETDGGFPGYGLTKHDAEELANAANRVKMTEWQPIETAPKDGTEILVFRMDCGFTAIAHVAFYRSEEEWDECLLPDWESKEEFVGWWSYVRNSISQEKLDGIYTPTHWMPLPELPKQEAK